MAAAGYEPELIQEAGVLSLQAVEAMLKKLPPHDWVSKEVRGLGQHACGGPWGVLCCAVCCRQLVGSRR
jgi:hypothetical protein